MEKTEFTGIGASVAVCAEVSAGISTGGEVGTGVSMGVVVQPLRMIMIAKIGVILFKHLI
jgi:hypothetical protein